MSTTACDDQFAPAPPEQQPSGQSAAPSPDIAPGCDMTRNWAVTVQAEGTDILTLSSEHCAGVPDLGPWESTIRGCAEHLMAFIGQRAQPAAATVSAYAVLRDAIVHGVGACIEIDGRQIHIPAEVLPGEQPSATAPADGVRAALTNLVREAQAVADDYHRPRYARLDDAIASARAALAAPADNVQSLKARIAYASEFLPIQEGDDAGLPDVGNIHANIRALKALVAPTAPQCKTCNDRGIIGGPSYCAPDEGGEPCPDCAAPQAEADAREAKQRILDAAQWWADQRELGPRPAKEAWAALAMRIDAELAMLADGYTPQPAAQAAPAVSEDTPEAIEGTIQVLKECGGFTEQAPVIRQLRRYATLLAAPTPPAQGQGDDCDDVDAILRIVGLDPERCRTEGGALNVGRVRTLWEDVVSLAAQASGEAAPSDEEIETLARDYCDDPTVGAIVFTSTRDCVDFARALLSRYGQAPAASVEPVAWLVDWPDEPELGHYLTESPGDIDSGRRRALVFRDAAPVAASAEPRSIGYIDYKGNHGHARAVLTRGMDEQGNDWADGTKIYAAPVAAQAPQDITSTTAARDQFPMLYDSLDALDERAAEQPERIGTKRHLSSLRASIQAVVQKLSLARARIADLESAAQEPAAAIPAQVSRAISRARTAMSMWENGHAFDVHGVAREIQREIDAADLLCRQAPAADGDALEREGV